MSKDLVIWLGYLRWEWYLRPGFIFIFIILLFFAFSIFDLASDHSTPFPTCTY